MPHSVYLTQYIIATIMTLALQIYTKQCFSYMLQLCAIEKCKFHPYLLHEYLLMTRWNRDLQYKLKIDNEDSDNTN